MFEGPSTAEWAASDASHARKRIEVIEKRLELLRVILCGERPISFDERAKLWAACDPPPPPHQPIDYSELEKLYPHHFRPTKLLGDK